MKYIEESLTTSVFKMSLAQMQFDRLRSLLRFHPPKEFDALIDSMYQKAQLQRKVRLYQEYRKSGLTKVKQISQYTAEKKKFLNKDNKDGM